MPEQQHLIATHSRGIWCSLATYSIVLYIIENDPVNYAEHYPALLEASAHLELLWEFFDHWARGSILVMLVYLGTGIHRVSRGSSAFWHRLVRWGTLAMAFIIFATSAAYYGFQVNNLVNWYSGTGPESEAELIDDWETADRLVSATSILIWITSLGQVGLSIFIWLLASGMRSVSSTNPYPKRRRDRFETSNRRQCLTRSCSPRPPSSTWSPTCSTSSVPLGSWCSTFDIASWITPSPLTSAFSMPCSPCGLTSEPWPSLGSS